MGVPGFALALLASRLREPARRAPASIAATLTRWYESGVRDVVRPTLPLLGLATAGAAVSGVIALFEGVPSGVDTAVFRVFVSARIVWAAMRLLSSGVP